MFIFFKYITYRETNTNLWTCKQITNGESFAKNIDTMTFDNKLQRIFNLISKITAIVVICRFPLMIFSEGFRRGWMKCKDIWEVPISIVCPKCAHVKIMWLSLVRVYAEKRMACCCSPVQIHHKAVLFWKSRSASFKNHLPVIFSEEQLMTNPSSLMYSHMLRLEVQNRIVILCHGAWRVDVRAVLSKQTWLSGLRVS